MLKKIYYKLNQSLKIQFSTLFKKHYSLNDLDKKLEKYINYNDGYYFELVSFDGITQSNIFYYEKN
ncbi:MAG: hypothetical protein CBE33_07020 [Candidatus Pelagibacter sp. TMED273]|nr:MAG: hypothetical protein CBE33_07020 [Candidatus Pelagibacter sp. TMED273]|tara:strand:- start:3679 stop:3876 length:198 start_codon:yes stop_codon:yes gene_type:complete